MLYFKKLIKNPLTWIFLLALILRIYRLGELPYGFHIDEAKVAWNSLSILKTGHDDNGNVFSLYYNTFGDYRPTGLFYVTGASIAIFGRTIFATRFPVALFGALMTVPIYFLIDLIDKDKRKFNKKITISHLGALLVAMSPWQINLSRATNEVIVSTFFALLALYFFIKLIKSKNTKFGLATIATITLSYFFYHAIRFLAPAFFIITFIYYKTEINANRKKLFIYLSLITTFLLTLFFSTTRSALARFSQVSIFKGVDTVYQIERLQSENTQRTPFTIMFDNKYVVYFKVFMDQYSSYFAGDFLIGPSGKPYRFSTPGMGLITYIEAVLLITGGIMILKGKKSALPLLLLLAAPLPAAITSEDVPNLSRAFLMLPFLIILESYGLETIILISKKYKKKIAIIVFSLLTLNFLYFSYTYFYHSVNHRPFLKNYTGDSPTYRNIGAKELSLKLDSLKDKYDYIIVTSFPDNVYPWYAYFTNKDPKKFNETFKTTTNERIYNNIIFSEQKCPSDDALIKYAKKDILIIDSWECPYEDSIKTGYPLKITDIIKRPDGSVVYAFLERDKTKPLLFKGVYY